VGVDADRDRLARRLLAIGLTCAAAFAVLAVEATSGQPNRLDREAADVLAASKGGVGFRVADLVSVGGSPVFVVLAAVGLAALVWFRRRDLRLAALCVLAPAVAGVLQLVAKELVGPQQPVWFNPWFPERALAFPSGHATGAASIATLVILLSLTSTRSRSQRAMATTVALVYVIAVAASRVVIDDHLAMDVIGGVLLGVAVTAIGGAVALPHAHVGRRSRSAVST
jgi:undecaprenyl-diphosphatase